MSCKFSVAVSMLPTSPLAKKLKTTEFFRCTLSCGRLSRADTSEIVDAKGVLVPDDERSTCPLKAESKKRKREEEILAPPKAHKWTSKETGLSEDLLLHFPLSFTLERWEVQLAMIKGRSAVEIRQDATERRIDEKASKPDAEKNSVGDLAYAAAPAGKQDLRFIAGLVASIEVLDARVPPSVIPNSSMCKDAAGTEPVQDVMRGHLASLMELTGRMWVRRLLQ